MCITEMMWEDKYCPGCHYNHPKDFPRLKFHQELGCLELAKHGYLCWKDVTESSKVVDKFNTKLPKIPDQSRTSKPVAKRVSDNQASNHVSAIRVHSPSISNPPLTSSVPPDLIEKDLLLMLNQAYPMPTSNGYADL